MYEQSKRNSLVTLIVVLLVVLGILVLLAVRMDRNQARKAEEDLLFATQQTVPTTVVAEPVTESTTEPETEPTEPPVAKLSTATIGATGDILMHMPVVSSGYDAKTGTYNYDYIFADFRNCVNSVDYAVANLEVTLAGTQSGFAYQGYPIFNCPDAIVTALKNAGFDMLLTANNHSYDTGSKGFVRTQQVVTDAGLTHIGSRPSEEVKPYYIAEVNGIKIGMINYTYDTRTYTNGRVSLNGIPLSNDHAPLMNAFNYKYLDEFYAELQGRMEEMYQDGAEAIVLYIHWGDEYQIVENGTQRKMAQQLCNLGIDVIVGNHAHVPQPVSFLTSEQDETQKTLCLYSTGNALSNIYETTQFPVNTEDGMLFTFTFAKYSDGTVLVEGVHVIPTWVYRYTENYVRKFRVLYMDDTIEDWKTLMNLDDSTMKECEESYARTMAIVGAGVEAANQYYNENQKAVEAELGVK